MSRLVVIGTPRMRIESFSEAWLSERYVSWLNDPELMRFSENRHRRHTEESCREYAASFEGTPHYFWAIVAHDSALGHIGNITAYVNPEHGLADVGILVGERQVWGRGYGTEAWMAVCDFLLREVGLRKVTAGTLSVNRGMLSIMNRTGMQQDGVRVEHYLVNNEPVNMVHSALFRNAWLKRFPRGPFETNDHSCPSLSRVAPA